jgi:hypothetical protein
MAVETLAQAAAVDTDRIEALESGVAWADRRGELQRIAGALSVTVPDLVGCPIEPIDVRHAAIHASAFHLRRTLLGARAVRQRRDQRALEVMIARVAELPEAESSGDEAALAAALPDIVAALDVAADGTSDPTNHARITARALASGLLRRLGWLDLSWIMLEGLRPGDQETWSRRRLDQARLLADLGAYPLALVHAQAVVATVPRNGDGPIVVADLQARAGRVADAGTTLDRAEHAATDETDRARITVARLRLAVEAGLHREEEAARLAASIDFDLLPGADRALAGIAAASVQAVHGRLREAEELLLLGEESAPWRVRLDPLARDLIATLAARYESDGILRLAQRAGLL